MAPSFLGISSALRCSIGPPPGEPTFCRSGLVLLLYILLFLSTLASRSHCLAPGSRRGLQQHRNELTDRLPVAGTHSRAAAGPRRSHRKPNLAALDSRH